jgi:hypothetical protein
LGKAASPQYPRRSDVIGGNGWTGRRWRKAAGGAAAFLVAMSIGGCEQPSIPLIADVVKEQGSGGTEAARGTYVAPIFEHGDGFASMGCIVVNPPPFLSEEEAMLVIKAELAKRGIDLGRRAEFDDLALTRPLENLWDRKEDRYPRTTELFEADGWHNAKRIAVEFVSVADCDKLDPWTIFHGEYRSKKVASCLNDLVAKDARHACYFGVFYDPMVWPCDINESEAVSTAKSEDRISVEARKRLARDKAKTFLRRQVQDFVVWLDKQGVELSKGETAKKKANQELSSEKKLAPKKQVTSDN